MSSRIEQERTELTGLIQQILDEAKHQGATAAEADIGTGAGLTVTTRLGEVEKVEHERDKGLGLTVFFGNQKGSASSSDFGETAIKETVTAACNIAKFTSEDPYAGLPDAKLMASEVPDLNLNHPWDISPEDAIKLAVECEDIARAEDKRINNSDGTSVSTYAGNHFYGNTHGFIDGWHWSSHTIDCTVIAETKNGMQRDGWYSKARNRDDLQSINDIAKEAAKRTTQRLDAKKLSTRNCPVIFEAPIASGLFSAFVTAISGGSLYRKASFLLDKIDEQVFADHIHIHERPHLKGALGSAPFDNEGMATKNRDLIIDGVLQGYVLSSYSARKLGLPPTANAGGVHNLTIDTSEHDLDELVKQMDTGLLITDMIGFGVNQITGDYSRGAAGFWIENGEIQYPVEEITVAGNLIEMYKQIIHIGNDIDPRGNVLTGSVLIENMTIAGE
ncbi:MAG: PmbA protein [Gammaproteobacteria bacterium]|jgi:PmbA protein